MPFEHLLDVAASAAASTFRLSGRYYYEDRKTGQRYRMPRAGAELDLDITETDKDGVITLVRKGKGFLVPRPTVEELDAWRRSLDIDTRKKPTPCGGDRIVKVNGDKTERYEITAREPYSTIGPNNAMYRINTVFIHEEPTAGNP